MNNTPSGLARPMQEAIEIKLWEIYLITNRNHLIKTLSAYALDGGPIPDQKNISKVCFQFLRYDWDRTVQQMLIDNAVPYEFIRRFKTDAMTYLEKKKVYVAEDDLNILFALNTMLVEAGYDVIMSHCGAAMLKRDLPAADVFILDNRMPDVNGVDVCRHLKSQPATKDIPVIMISAHRSIGAQARNAGVDDFLEKPFEMRDLLELVSKHTTA
jgi:CheY-like chemotaxis protein